MHAVGLARMPADAHHDSSPTRAVMMTVASCHARQAARRVACSILACVLGAAGVPYVAAAAPTPEQITFFESKIRPVLVEHCYQCHSAEALRSGRLKANLLVDSREGMHKGGESGAAVVPGRRDESLLLAAIRYDGFEMPPTGRLPDTVIADFETWIDMGAPDPRDEPAASTEERTIDVEAGRRHWSYRRLAPVSPPRVEHDAWPRNDIDRFILARQESAGIAPNEEAAKETLLRRVTFDLTGLPPTVEELEAFLADTSGDAYDRVVDRLLASPRHGERWARHWLDAVRIRVRRRPSRCPSLSRLGDQGTQRRHALRRVPPDAGGGRPARAGQLRRDGRDGIPRGGPLPGPGDREDRRTDPL